MAKAGSFIVKNKEAKICSDRKTQVHELCTAGAADFVVIQLLGCKGVQCLNHYKRLALSSHSITSKDTHACEIFDCRLKLVAHLSLGQTMPYWRDSDMAKGIQLYVQLYGLWCMLHSMNKLHLCTKMCSTNFVLRLPEQ